MSFPRPSQDAKAFFSFVMPDDPYIQVRPMFGNLAGFINGNMFVGLFGEQIFIRLPEQERRELLTIEGTSEFAPMPSRPMKEYVALPESWNQEPDQIRTWIQRSLAWAESLPEKVPAKKKPKKA
ncbi:Transcriptional regulator of competence genes, TfoX/Sxy family [Paenibacillus sp. yr247]|uniref:TfoX/Sxy family protein n=1 Tax=Paenibacillus sp. yr247 TaxID=1761880 RepID=UPI0008910CB1|nr:TfoX/Sxy family protein [Paenibacillus sp. yr247]SDN41594.1 Transcriptional regulator of competence genes, TfoX/Sxy family [Paenibacillus sp. yr247]